MQDSNDAATPAPLLPEQLYRQCDPEALGFEHSDKLEPLEDHFGQDRALEALLFGLDIAHEGYNLFVLGSTGVGKRELLDSVLDQQTPPRGELYDWCYVNNFKNPDRPIALRLPVGMAIPLRDDMIHAVEELLGILPATFQSDEYQTRVQDLGESYQDKEKEAFQQLAEKAGDFDIAMIQTPNGYTLAPTRDGEILKPQEFDALPQEIRDKTLEVIEQLKEELKAIVRQVPGWQKESRAHFRQLNKEFCQLAIDPVFDELEEKYSDHPQVIEFLQQAHNDVMTNAELFVQGQEESPIPDNVQTRARQFKQYSVNVLVDNGNLPGSPLVHEDNPSFGNLVGRCESLAQMGNLVTDFSLIKPGALHTANGGYLVLEAEKLLTSPASWNALKNALKAREIRIQSMEQWYSFGSTMQLRPEPIPLDVKVVVTGDRYIYYLLEQNDPEFATLFKVAVDMSEDVPRTASSTQLFARLVATLAQRQSLLPFTADGVARTIEQSARRVADAERLSLHQGRLTNLLCESDYFARKDQADRVTATHVQQAIDAAIHRMDQFRERSHESILRDIMLVDTEGSRVGQVNGLAVYQLGDYSFGKPSRITATARLGSGRVLDIEREVDLGGKIHSKGVMIISALLANRYARNKPLPLAATIAFEQSYGGVDGDSASVAELVALISALTDIPVKQSLAVTGSLNQHGQVQAIGGVNEKIEGFYAICQERGLTGDQGVIVPSANQVHLMLREDVLAAVKAGQFAIYAVETIDQALALLIGEPPGTMDDQGIYPADSINGKVMARVAELNKLARALRGQKPLTAEENDDVDQDNEEQAEDSDE